MGVVLRVNHLEWNRELAVKLPRPNMVASKVMRERYLREAETWIALGAHPHIARCWFVKSIVGVPGLFLDYLSGGSLEDLIKNRAIELGDWSRILLIILQAAEGLAYAHSQGVVHRDVKPDNFLLSETGRVCVTDFGLVKGLRPDSLDSSGASSASPAQNLDTGITGVGAFLGTPRYGAPEQWGTAENVGPQADIYALGIILYEMLCGRRPFDTEDEDLEVEQLLERHLKTAPPDPRSFYGDIPEDLVEVTMSCLQKKPTLRPQDMATLIDFLAPLYEGFSGQSYRPPERLPDAERPDLLNNIAVSFYSIGQTDRARDLLQKGLRIESGHPECLYNLVQLDRREGRLEPIESLRRLRQAGATFPLALLCIEEGLGKQAHDLLSSIPKEQHSGVVLRTLADAQMYAQEYLLAQRTYRKAEEFMPNDRPTRLRKLLAIQGARGLDGHVFFPSSTACLNDRVPNPDLTIDLDCHSRGILGFSQTEAVYYDLEERRLGAELDRPEGAGRPLRVWTSGDQVLLQDETAYELWLVPKLKLAKRVEGRILAVTPGLKKLLTAKPEGVFLLDQAAKKRTQLKFPPDLPQSGRLWACFSSQGGALCLVLPDGRVAQITDQGDVRPLAWPPSLAAPAEIRALCVDHNGVLTIGYRDGRLQALDFAGQQITYSHQFPFPIESLESERNGAVTVVSSSQYSGIVNAAGEIIHRCQGPIAVDSKRKRCLAYAHGVLELYELHPFRRVRSWAQTIPPPIKLSLAADGRLAISLSVNGEYHVWEVDEDNRVFERNLLLCPGRSYEDLIEAYQRYRVFLTQALEKYREDDLVAANWSLTEARNVEGYRQSAEALELQWHLISRLGRAKLEAVWERYVTRSYKSLTGALSSDGKWLAIFRPGAVTGYYNQVSETKTIWQIDLKSQIILAEFLDDAIDDDTPGLILMDQLGRGSLVHPSDGERVHPFKLEQGPIAQCCLGENSIFFLTHQGVLGVYHLDTGKCKLVAEEILQPIVAIHPWTSKELVVQMEDGHLQIDFSGPKAKATNLPLAVPPPAAISALTIESQREVLLWGFQDGSLMISARSSGKVLHRASFGLGAITGIKICVPLALGVASTDKGRLIFWDLDTGEILDQFPADSHPITRLCLSDSGRYLTTLDRKGQLKLWETFFSSHPQGEKKTVDWMPGAKDAGALSQFLRWS